MLIESTYWSVDGSLNLDGTRSCSTRKGCTTRCGGSRLVSARRLRRGSNGTKPEWLWLPAAAELCSAWTAEGGCLYANGRGARPHTSIPSRPRIRLLALHPAGALGCGRLDPASCVGRWLCRLAAE